MSLYFSMIVYCEDNDPRQILQKLEKQHAEFFNSKLTFSIPNHNHRHQGDGFLYLKIANLPPLDVSIPRELGVILLFCGFYWLKSYLHSENNGKNAPGLSVSPSEFTSGPNSPVSLINSPYEVIGKRLND